MCIPSTVKQLILWSVAAGLLLAGIPAAAGPAQAAGSEYRLQLIERSTHCVVRSFPVHAGEAFSIDYVHSSDHTPVVDCFQVTDDGHILLREERFAWYGAGLAFHPSTDIDLSRRWSSAKVHRIMDPFYLRVGRVARHTLYLRDQEIPLKEIVPGGTSLWIRVTRTGESSHE